MAFSNARKTAISTSRLGWNGSLGGFDRAFDDALYPGAPLLPLWMGVSVNDYRRSSPEKAELLAEVADSVRELKKQSQRAANHDFQSAMKLPRSGSILCGSAEPVQVRPR